MPEIESNPAPAPGRSRAVSHGRNPFAPSCGWVIGLTLASSAGLGDLPVTAAWGHSRKTRNRAVHALNGNGRPSRGRREGQGRPVSSPSTGVSGNSRRVILTRPSSSPSSSPSPAVLRARVAGRAALPAELTAAGYAVNLPLPSQELLHLHRRRLTSEERSHVLGVVGATHIVGDDALCPTTGRGGSLQADFWKIAPTFAWGDAVFHSPLVVFPDHLTRLRERVAWELAHNSQVQAVHVLVTIPRAALDGSTDWASFAQKVDPALLVDWGTGNGVEAAVAFAAPLQLLRFPAGATTIPPATWDFAPLLPKVAAVVLRISRHPSGRPSFTPTFRKEGSFSSWEELRAKDRAGLVRVAVEVDLVQRPCAARVDVRAFGRRVLSDLLAATSAVPAGFPSLPLQGVMQRGDMVRGFVDLPATLAAPVLRASGAVRGVFARPWVAADASFPWPPGFSATSHRIVWVKVARFSDLLTHTLRAAGVSFDGLVCPRQRGEVGVRMAAETDVGPLRVCLEALGAQVKLPRAGVRAQLRASGVPVALLCSLDVVAQALHPALKVIDRRVLRTTYDSLVVDLMVEGPALPGNEWRLSGLGSRLVLVKRVASRRSVPVAAPLLPTSRVPPPRRPLTSGEHSSWASVVRGGPSDAAPMEVEGSLPPPVPAPTSAPLEVSSAIPEDAEIPLRRRPAQRPHAGASATSSALASAPPAGVKPSAASSSSSTASKKAPRGGISAFFPKAPRASTSSTTPAAESASSSSSHRPGSDARASGAARPSAAASSVVAPVPVASPSASDSRFLALESQVAALSALLTEQRSLNTQLQEQLRETQEQCADLSLRLRAAPAKRSHSACASITSSPDRHPTGIHEDESMPSPQVVAASAVRRRLIGGPSPNDDDTR